MKVKLFFILPILSVFCLTNVRAQTTKISFETTEPYNLGTLIGQHSWQVWSENNAYPASMVNVVNTN